MFFRYRTEGVVIYKKNIGDFDRVLTVYTKEFGKLRLFAKSIRKSTSKLRSGAEPFSLVEIEFINGKTKKTLTDIKTINPYLRINRELGKTSIGDKIFNDIDKTIKDEERDSRVWNLVKRVLLSIDSDDMDFYTYHLFFWELITILGYGPQLYCCSECSGPVIPGELALSSVSGGLVCGACYSDKTSFPVTDDVVKIIRIILKDKKKFKKIKIDESTRKSLWIISEKYNPIG